MNWKISKIEVSSFKAFKHIYLDLGESALLTLDGPNGYGKNKHIRRHRTTAYRSG